MQRCALPSNARAVSKQLLLPNGRALVRIPRRSFADAATATTPKPPGGVGRTLRRIALFSTLATGTFYVGSTFLSFRSTQYHDFFVEQVPLGTSVLQFAEDHDWDELDVHAVTDAVVAAGAGVSGAWQKVKELTGQAESEAEKKVDASSAEAAKARDAAFNRAIAARDAVVNKAKDTTTPKQPTLKEKAIEKKDAVVSKAKAAAASTKEAVSSATDKAKQAATGLVTSVEKSTESASAVARSQADQFSSEIEHLTSQAEAVLSGKKSISEILADAEHSVAEAVSENVTTPEDVNAEAKENLYTAPLPIGFEPPPGFSRPAPPKPAKTNASKATGKDAKSETGPPPEPLPLLAPAVAALGASEPVISQLAGTIDTLASSLAPSTSSPANSAIDAKARAALSNAQSELEALAARVESVRSDARAELEKTLEAQAAEYNSKVLSVEMEAQDRMDAQEDGFRKILQEEREEMVRRYREKLEKELEVQSEIIDQRLKEEVIAQGIELQRRWIREVKVRVENERGGRLSKLEELAASLKRLEGLALDNARVLDDTARAHALWSALRAVGGAVTAPVRKPFRAELRILRAAAGNKNVSATDTGSEGEAKSDVAQDDVLKAALGILEAGETADVGVEPLSALTAWFRTSVAPAVERVALVPDHGAGLLSHLASHLLSTVRFRHEVAAGNQLPKGGDVLSVLARAGYWLEEKDLDKAAREVNQLSGVGKELVKDWLEAARRRLEVEQALEIIQSEATVASLLVA